jgi:hypothetical protein
MQSDHVAVDFPALKIASAWFAAALAHVGIHTWGEAASFMAFLYTMCLFLEWVWRKWTRSCLEQRGIVKRRLRRKDDGAMDALQRDKPIPADVPRES